VLYARTVLADPSFGRDAVAAVASRVVLNGRNGAVPGWPLMWVWHDKAYLGAAHGVAGILYTLLCLEDGELRAEDKASVIATVDALLRLETGGHLGHFPSSLGPGGAAPPPRPPRLVQWCHGAPGMIHLLCRAFEVTNKQGYLDAAVRCGHAVWETGLLRKGVGLCHGIAGNAYVFLRLARATGDEHWHDRAVSFARFAVDHLHELASVPSKPHSLYEGTLGLAALLVDLCAHDTTERGAAHACCRFPAFEF
jgi:lantibiotic modifying enzyme